ncbi:MAG: DUF4259 domain-containing protein [Corynebacterium sp.]|uniref:DUF4259 domain-containing protein n=1 Tax=Corynebacterium sp. TaxID=1720 RepID=UPI0026DD2E1E|nr:DUF4259 domain-containing protein [Corynebacterium sp.]MDO5097599.1 DUF4259 domain-containing protein [Corynebacterium sp.]
MAAWDIEVFSRETNVDFLDDLANLDSEDIVEAVEDACQLVVNGDPTAEEIDNGQCAATIAAIWAGAPFSASETADEYPFIRELVGSTSEELAENALVVLQAVGDTDDEDIDVEAFIEAVS